jgi:hypothetical protein
VNNSDAGVGGGHNAEESFYRRRSPIQALFQVDRVGQDSVRQSGGRLGVSIGVVNLVHSDGQGHLVDCRLYHNAAGSRAKNDHFKCMLVNAVADKGLSACLKRSLVKPKPTC